MSTHVLPAISKSDAELVAASRGGNREAFGVIVRKYQGMVSGLIYAACGDVHRSEDLAQETFISAWKSLSGLREPGKLAGWLCGIARHRVADQFRESVTERVRLVEGMERVSGEEPGDEMMVAEEREMLWRTLSRIPQPYRETMVLYYRQGQSTAEVAAAMETTDEGVRQRLNRGRRMLREEMAGVVERGLASTAPGAEFSVGVVAALPMAVGQAAGMAVGAKGSVAAKGGVLFFLTAWAAPILAVLSMGVITGQSIYLAKGKRRRGFVIGYWVVFWLSIAAWVWFSNLLVQFGQRRHWGYSTFVPVISATWCGYCMVLFAMTVLSGSRAIANRDLDKGYFLLRGFWARFIFITPLIYLGVGWLVRLSLRAGDEVSAGVIGAAALAGSLICAARGPKGGRYDSVKMAFESWLCMVIIVLGALNWRLLAWTAVVDHSSLAEVRREMSLWSVNVCGAILFGWMVLVSKVMRRD